MNGFLRSSQLDRRAYGVPVCEFAVARRLRAKERELVQ